MSSCSGSGWTSIKDGGARASAVLLIGLDANDGRVRGVRYVPIEWRRRGGRYELTPWGRVASQRLARVWSTQNELAQGEAFAPLCP